MSLYNILYEPVQQEEEHENKNKIKIQYVAIIASLISIIGIIPQIIYITRTKDVKSFSYIWLTGLILSSLLWLIFGLANKIFADIMVGIFSCVVYSYFLYTKKFLSKP